MSTTKHHPARDFLISSPNIAIRIKKFLKFVNSQNPNIQLISEVESINSLNFLDININKLKGSFAFNIYINLQPRIQSYGIAQTSHT